LNKKLLIIGVSILALIILLTWLFIESSKPLPGQKQLQDGRNHVDEGSKVEYKFNPPTSGDHYASWISKGFYDIPRVDGSLVHSLEHGYIVIWYNCEKKVTGFRLQGMVKEAYAQTAMTQGSEGSPSATLEDMPKEFSDGSCNELKSQLKNIYQKLGSHKLIITPRVGMDSQIVLTAWGRAEKLSSADEGKVKEFVNAYRDAGPEQTNEP
jgi:hypothetical protein